MPDPREIGPAYTALLLETRRRGFRLTAQAVAQLEAALREVARRIEDELAAGDTPLTEARAVSLRRQILALLEAFQGQVVRSTVRSVGLTIDQLLALHQQVTDRLAREFLGAAIPGIAGRFDQLAIRAAGVLAARSSNAAAFRTLIRRHIEEAAPALDRLLIGAVARGVSVRRLTRDVAELLRTAVADSPLRDYGLAIEDVTGLGSIQSDARRIATTETLNALREANAQAMQASPIILAARWTRSGRHHHIDECDILAELDFYGYGPGYYPPERWPLGPHPHCACVQGGPTIFRQPSEWGRPKPPLRPLIASPAAEPWVEVLEGVEEWTPARRTRAIEVVTASLGRTGWGRSRRAA